MKKTIILVSMLLVTLLSFGQNFEKPKTNADEFENVKVKVGADFALQLQSLSHEADVELLELKKNFNLPTASFSITADLAPGIQLYMNTFLSSRHHNEAWVEGGYMTIDRLPFLPAADNIMKYMTIKAGVFNPNYGDGHFYRTTNAAALNNPFVGNWIMDSYTTNPGMEIMFRKDGFLAMVGTNNGRLNYGRGTDLGKDLVYNWKLSYDKQINEDLRVRASLSGYHVGEGHVGSYVWGGDRAGARYYDVMTTVESGKKNQDSGNYKTGRWDPTGGQSQMNSYQANLFVKFHGLEVFSIYENMKGVKKDVDQHFTQTAVQAIYRIGDFYLGTRLNKVDNNDGSSVSRTNFGGGWFMTDNTVIKLDRVKQNYKGAAHGGIDGGEFKGLVLEAAISF